MPTRNLGDSPGSALRIDALPAIGRPAAVPHRQPGQPVTSGVPGGANRPAPSVNRNVDPSEGDGEIDGCRDALAPDTVLFEIIERHGEVAILLPSVVQVLDEDPHEHRMRRVRQRPERMRLEHFGGEPGPAGTIVPRIRGTIDLPPVRIPNG